MIDKKQQAQRLYMHQCKTQKEISIEIGVSERTVYTWIHQYAWDKLKLAALQAPATISENLCCQLIELQNAIARREPGTRYPSPQEAEVSRKLITGIEKMKKFPSLSQNMQMFETFKNFIRPIDKEFTKKLADYSERYLEGKSVNGFAPYQMEYGVEQVAPVMSVYQEPDEPYYPEEEKTAQPDPSSLPYYYRMEKVTPIPAITAPEKRLQYLSFMQDNGYDCQDLFYNVYPPLETADAPQTNAADAPHTIEANVPHPNATGAPLISPTQVNHYSQLQSMVQTSGPEAQCAVPAPEIAPLKPAETPAGSGTEPLPATTLAPEATGSNPAISAALDCPHIANASRNNQDLSEKYCEETRSVTPTPLSVPFPALISTPLSAPFPRSH